MRRFHRITIQSRHVSFQLPDASTRSRRAPTQSRPPIARNAVAIAALTATALLAMILTAACATARPREADTVLLDGEVLLSHGTEQNDGSGQPKFAEAVAIADGHKTGEAIPGVFPGALSPREVVPDLLAVIKMHTINAAYEMHEEQSTGSIEVGKYAGMIVLSQNLFRIPTEKISDTRIMLTLLGGKIVYRAANAGPLAAPAKTSR